MNIRMVDSKKRIVLPAAKPGQAFACNQSEDGSIRLVPVKAEVRPERVVIAKLVRKGKALFLDLAGAQADEQTIGEAIGRAVREERDSRQ